MGWKVVAVGWRTEVVLARGGEPDVEVSESSESLSMSAGKELRWEVKAGESRQETSCEAAFLLAEEEAGSGHRVLWDLMQPTFLWRKAEHCRQVL